MNRLSLILDGIDPSSPQLTFLSHLCHILVTLTRLTFDASKAAAAAKVVKGGFIPNSRRRLLRRLSQWRRAAQRSVKAIAAVKKVAHAAGELVS